MDARVAIARPLNPPLWARHLANFGPLALITAAAFVLACERPVDGTALGWRLLYGAVVALNALSLAMSSWSAALGAALRVLKQFGIVAEGPIIAPPTGRAHTAVLIAIHEEDAARVCAAARAIADDTIGTGVGHLDVFVLSDSQSPAAIATEPAMMALVARDAEPRLFYRRRSPNTGRKPGNIADFVERWGAAYDFMVMLDADSLMTGACIARLVGVMEANPRAGLVQAMSYAVGRRTLFARFQQFDSRLVGPIFQAGVSFWQGPRGNYWGHNAIVRTASFAESCGLPILPGSPPLGGEILSHDTVEAALMLRGGHDIWMLAHGPDGQPDESWEETPTNLLDHLQRDRRWLRGNLQHVHVLAASGLKAASYYHLLRGLSHFLYAPLVLAWVILYVALDRHAGLDGLAALFLALLVTPRGAGLVAALATQEQVLAAGGRLRLAGSALLDGLLLALFYPVVVAAHLATFVELVVGGEEKWDGQSRDDRGVRWREAARQLAVPVLAAGAGLVAMAPFAPLPALLLGPGLILGPPLAVLTSRRIATRLFEIPEDARPHPLRAARMKIEQRLRAGLPTAQGGAPCALPPQRELAMPKQMLKVLGSAA